MKLSAESRALDRLSSYIKTARQKVKERTADLHDDCCYFILDFCSYRLVYMDESGREMMRWLRRTSLHLVQHE